VTFSPDGARLAAGTRDWQVVLWDLASGRQEFVLSGHRSAVASVGFSPDGRTLASGGQDGTVRLWRAAAAQELAVLEGHTGRVLAVAFSPDGRTLASGGETPTGGGEVYLWPSAPGTRPGQGQGN
jgi:WD40 repeat protein